MSVHDKLNRTSPRRLLILDREGGPVFPKLFTYVRWYNAELSREGLDALRLNHIRGFHENTTSIRSLSP